MITHFNQIHLLYQQALKYNHHAINCITLFGLRLKKKLAIIPMSPGIYTQWNGILKDAEQKLLKLLLKETQDISVNANSTVNEIIKR